MLASLSEASDPKLDESPSLKCWACDINDYRVHSLRCTILPDPLHAQIGVWGMRLVYTYKQYYTRVM